MVEREEEVGGRETEKERELNSDQHVWYFYVFVCKVNSTPFKSPLSAP